MLSVADMRIHLRVSGEVLDSEIEMLINAALADMERVGINVDSADYAESMMNMALVCFCKARFGFDNPDSARYEELYRQAVIDLLNSKASNPVEPAE